MPASVLNCAQRYVYALILNSYHIFGVNEHHICTNILRIWEHIEELG